MLKHRAHEDQTLPSGHGGSKLEDFHGLSQDPAWTAKILSHPKSPSDLKPSLLLVVSLS